MSLKAVHIVFVTLATLVTAVFAFWAVRHYQVTGSGGDLFLAVLAVLGTVCLPIYGVWFLKKMKGVGYV